MTIETDLNVMEHAGRTWRFTLKNESGEVLPLDGYVIYGAAECPGQALRAFSVEVKGGVATVRMPGLPVGDWPWKYQLFVQEVSSRVEWLLCCGSVNVLGRVAGGHVALSPEQLEFTGVLDRVTQQASIVVGENMVSIAENARRANQAALDSQIARGDAEDARDGALAARSGAEAARDGAQVAQGGAEDARDGALAARSGAEDARDGALAALAGAEEARGGALAAQGEAEAARDGAQVAQGGAEDARDGALAAQGGAEDARDGALAARSGAEVARDGALAARSGAEVARDGALAALAGAEGAQAVAEDAAGVAQGFAQRAAGAADEAVLAAAEAKAAEAGSAAAADVVRYDFLPMTLEWLDGRFTKMLGAGKFSMTYTEEENTLRVAFAIETTAAQIEESRALFDRVLPRNLVTEISEVPMGFKKLEWIGNEGGAYIDSELYLNSDYEISTAFISNHTSAQGCIFGNEIARSDASPALNVMMVNYNTARFDYGTEMKNRFITNDWTGKRWLFETNKNIMTVSIPELKINISISAASSQFDCTKKHYIFACGAAGYCNAIVRLLSLSGKVNEVTQFDFIPAFDEAAGAPCLFDKVRRKMFYNIGTGDFTYPGMETEATTYSLRNRMYAQYTEHGIRRLYRVPEGYGSKAAYAAENGFKILVETPMPEEGYWTPVWHDRADCIELEWVETEAPTVEETLT